MPTLDELLTALPAAAQAERDAAAQALNAANAQTAAAQAESARLQTALSDDEAKVAQLQEQLDAANATILKLQGGPPIVVTDPPVTTEAALRTALGSSASTISVAGPLRLAGTIRPTNKVIVGATLDAGLLWAGNAGVDMIQPGAGVSLRNLLLGGIDANHRPICVRAGAATVLDGCMIRTAREGVNANGMPAAWQVTNCQFADVAGYSIWLGGGNWLIADCTFDGSAVESCIRGNSPDPTAPAINGQILRCHIIARAKCQIVLQVADNVLLQDLLIERAQGVTADMRGVSLGPLPDPNHPEFASARTRNITLRNVRVMGLDNIVGHGSENITLDGCNLRGQNAYGAALQVVGYTGAPWNRGVVNLRLNNTKIVAPYTRPAILVDAPNYKGAWRVDGFTLTNNVVLAPNCKGTQTDNAVISIPDASGGVTISGNTWGIGAASGGRMGFLGNVSGNATAITQAQWQSRFPTDRFDLAAAQAAAGN